MSTIKDKFDHIVTSVLDAMNIRSIGNNVSNASRLIQALESEPNKKYKVIGICGGCAARLSIPLLAILKRHHVTCSECDTKHTSHDSLDYHSTTEQRTS